MKIKQALLGLSTALAFSVSAFAAPVQFNITTMSFTPGGGYGVNSEELLDVAFTPSAAPAGFTLDLAGTTSKTFNVGTVQLKEVCINPGSCPKPPQGAGNETDDLDVNVTFHFINPVTGDLTATLTGAAKQGPVDDDKVDYTLDFTAGDYTFGDGGKFRLDISDLSFSAVGTQTLTATITLLNAPREVPPPTNVPEPASLALMGLGLAGLAARGKRRKA